MRTSGRIPVRVLLALAALALVFATGLVIGTSRGLPFVGHRRVWSIGIFSGDAPLHLQPTPGLTQPVLTARDVTDIPAVFVADPFLVRTADIWLMFFEVLHADTGRGVIALAESPDGRQWTYRQVVLDEPFHLSYPLVFDHEGSYYMVPETHEAGAVRLYRATDFPTRWEHVEDLVPETLSDPTIFQHEGRWWMFAEHGSEILRLYAADTLLGPWKEHPKSPLHVAERHISRPGGRVVHFQDKVYRLTQDTQPTYGNQLRAFEITTLTATDYAERQAPGNPVLIKSGAGWNGLGMHHLDAVQADDGTWVAAVDGYGEMRVFGWSY